jgi:hypothetical protein
LLTAAFFLQAMTCHQQSLLFARRKRRSSLTMKLPQDVIKYIVSYGRLTVVPAGRT